MRVALVRHPAVAVAPGVCYGQTDVALSAAGWAAIPGMVAALAGLSGARVWTSPAQRCVAVAEALGAPFQRDARLLELDFGAWEGVAWDDVPRAALDLWAARPADFAAPGGESVAALGTRVRSFHDDLRRSGQDSIVITHGGVLKLLRPLLHGAAIDLLRPAPAIGSVDVIAVPPSP